MRVSALSRGAGGEPVPKQYCTFGGDTTLLGRALRRAGAIVSSSRILVVVAERHRRHWEPALAGLPPENVVVQPRNRGTAAGVLLPVLEVYLRRDRGARFLVLPADHDVRQETVLRGPLLEACRAVRALAASLTPARRHPGRRRPGVRLDRSCSRPAVRGAGDRGLRGEARNSGPARGPGAGGAAEQLHLRRVREHAPGALRGRPSRDPRVLPARGARRGHARGPRAARATASTPTPEPSPGHEAAALRLIAGDPRWVVLLSHRRPGEAERGWIEPGGALARAGEDMWRVRRLHPASAARGVEY
jgi:CTP:molybdopterin cytidylyltransferase MocA